MKRIYLLLFLSICISVSAQNNALLKGNLAFQTFGLPPIFNYTPKIYHSNPQNHDAVQDDKGIMYFGNLWGVLQFDGTEWTKIYLPNGASCTSLAKDENGTIFIGGRNEIGYLDTDSIGRKHYVSLVNNIPKAGRRFNEVWGTYATAKGVLFVSYEALLFKPNGKNEVQLLRKNIANAFFTNNKILIVDKEGLSIIKDGELITLISHKQLKNSFIRSVTFLNNMPLITTEAGLFIYDHGTLKVWDTPVNKLFASIGLDKIRVTTNNQLVFTSLLNGIVITNLKGEILLHLNKASGLLANAILGCYVDKGNNLWVTSNAGISYIPLSDQLTFLNDYSGITGIPYSSAIYNGSIYLSTSEGLFKRKISHGYSDFQKRFEKVEGVSGLIWNLFTYDNKLFCGQATGAYIIDQDNIKRVLDQGTWLFLPVKGENLIIAGTYKGMVVLEKKNGNWIYRNAINGFDISSRFLVEDKFGDLWISHGNKGIYKIRLNKSLTTVSRVRFFGRKNGLPADFDNTIYKINNEIIISGFKGVFSYDYQNEKIVPYASLTNILGADVHVEYLYQNSENQIWVIYDEGMLAKIGIVKGNYKVISKTKRLKNNWVESFEHINSFPGGQLFLGTQDGFAVYSNQYDVKSDSHSAYNSYVSKLETIDLKPETIWNGYSVGETPFLESLPYEKRSLKISFTAPSFDDVQNMQYQFYLQGFDSEKKWSPWNNNSFKEYTNLREGKYNFHLRAMNSDGKISRENTLTFEILPPWYRTWFAFTIYVLLASFSVYYGLLRTRNWLRSEKKKIELDKQRKLREKQKEWEEAALKKENELMKLQQEKLEVEALNLQQQQLLLEQRKQAEHDLFTIQQGNLEANLLAKNNELTSLTIHITQKNEVLSKIKSSLNKTIKDTEEEETRKSLFQIEQLIEKNLNSNKEWERFCEHFDLVHEGFLKKLQHNYPDLKASSLKLCAYIKMRLSSKQISVLLNTEPESVIKARYRLRLKFNLQKDFSLEEFLNQYVS